MQAEELQDNFWREALDLDPKNTKAFQDRYAIFMQDVQQCVAHLPQPEQDQIANRLIARNKEYMSMAKVDRNALRRRLGMPATPETGSRLVHVAAETAVRSTVWQVIAAFFRMPR